MLWSLVLLVAALVAAGEAAAVERWPLDRALKPTSQTPLAFVFYHLPHCKHCRAMWPAWEETAARLEPDPRIAVAAVDCHEFKQFCLSAGIDRYPTLRLHRRGAKPTTYAGPRTADSLAHFAMAHASARASGMRPQSLGVAMGHGRMWPRPTATKEPSDPAAPTGSQGQGGSAGAPTAAGSSEAGGGGGSAQQPAEGGGQGGRVRRPWTSLWGGGRLPPPAPPRAHAQAAKDEL